MTGRLFVRLITVVPEADSDPRVKVNSCLLWGYAVQAVSREA